MKCLKTIYCLIVSGLLVCEASTAGTSMTSQDFIDVASIKSISEIETAKIALQKSSSESVKSYAHQIIEEQTDLLMRLRKLANAEHLQMLSDIDLQAKAHSYVFQRNSKNFDTAYAEMRLIERKKSVSLFREAAELAGNDIKQCALQQLPILMHHLYMAQTLVDVTKDASLLADNASRI